MSASNPVSAMVTANEATLPRMPITLALPDEPFYDLIRCEETVNDQGDVISRSWEVVRTVAGLHSLKIVADLYVEGADRWNWYYQQVDAEGRPVGGQIEVAHLYEQPSI